MLFKMFYYVVFAVTMAISVAQDSTSEFKCRGIPNESSSCLGDPKIIPAALLRGCPDGHECDRVTCAFTIAGWLKDGQLNRETLKEYYDQYIKDHPEWTRAMEQAKTNCLRTDLPVQGLCVGSPAYDVSLCMLATLIQYAEPGQWSKKEECQNARRYAKECPPCPPGCFSRFVPYGACNVCLSLLPQK